MDAALAALQAEVHCISSVAAATGQLVGVLAPAPPLPARAVAGGDASGAATPRAGEAGGSAGASRLLPDGPPGTGLDAAVHHLQQELATLEAEVRACTLKWMITG